MTEQASLPERYPSNPPAGEGTWVRLLQRKALHESMLASLNCLLGLVAAVWCVASRDMPPAWLWGMAIGLAMATMVLWSVARPRASYPLAVLHGIWPVMFANLHIPPSIVALMAAALLVLLSTLREPRLVWIAFATWIVASVCTVPTVQTPLSIWAGEGVVLLAIVVVATYFLAGIGSESSGKARGANGNSHARIAKRKITDDPQEVSRAGDVAGWEWNVASGDVFFSPKWIQRLGYTVEEIGSHINSWKQLLHPDDLPRALQLLESHFRQETDRFQCELRLRDREGSYRCFLSRGHAVRDALGQPLRMLVADIDVGVMKRRELELREVLADAQKTTRAKSDFLANMSHEIRTPMTAILGYTEILRTGDLDLDQVMEALDTIERNGAHLMSVINNVLDVSKIESGKTEVEAIEYSPGALIAEVESLMRVRAAEKELPFRNICDGPIPKTLVGDPTRIRQILLIFTSNAIKFTRQGEVVISTGIEEQGERKRWRISVADTGIGMSISERKQVFQAFVQADETTARRFGGTGLGLRICRMLAEMIGATIDLVSEPNVGSTFTLYVPIDPTCELELVTPDQKSEGVTAGCDRVAQDALPRLDGAHVLLVEDGVDNARLVTALLTRAGAHVTHVENGKTALEMFASMTTDPIDVVLMDMQIPVMDGYQATREIHALEEHVPVIALTANALAEARRRCLDCGCNAFVAKPIDRAKMIHTICQLVDERRAFVNSLHLEMCAELIR